MSMLLFLDKCRNVRGVFDHGAAIVAARMAGEDVTAETIDDADFGFGGDEDKRFAHEMLWDGIIIEVEADVRLLARLHVATTSVSKGCAGKGKSRSRSSESASATERRSGLPGTGRLCATRVIQSASWAFRSSTVEKRRAAKN